MKIFGHPIHMMLVHFPSALFPMALLCAIIAYYTKDLSFAQASFYAMTGGATLGWAAIIFGAIDLLKLQEKKPDAVKTALIHGTINGTVVTVFTVLSFMQFMHYPSLKTDSIGLLIIKAITVGFMFAGNYLGGSLILKHKVAIENE